MMLFYTQLFTSKRGPLAKIWLAAHWERKLTKAHVFECNLEVTIRDILSPKMKIGLRTSGHLLLGVVRIYSRKAKYLLTDCNEALVQIRIAFRPGLTDLPPEDLAVRAKLITLVEDFTSFDIQLPHPSDIDVVDHFSLNQSRSEEITLKENFGNSFLTLGVLGEDLQGYTDALLDTSFRNLNQHGDKFGDEENECDLLDFLGSSSDRPEHCDFIQEESQNESVENTTNDQPVDGPAVAMEVETPPNNQATLLSNDERAFALDPVSSTPNSEKKRGKRRRKLVVDQNKQLSSTFIKEQLSDYSDLVASVVEAPPTAQQMRWKEKGSTDNLFAHLCTTVAAPQINEFFTQNFCLVKCWPEYEVVEKMREDVPKDLSFRTTDSVSSPPVNPEEPHHTENADLSYTDSHCADSLKNETRSETSHPELPSEDSLLVHPSLRNQDTQPLQTQPPRTSVPNSQDMEERRMTVHSERLLKALKQQSQRATAAAAAAFSLMKLCRGRTRSQAAATFLCFLILSKQKALVLHQSAPYQDIVATPGPSF